MSKYTFELTKETKLAPSGETLYRIRATQDIPAKEVKKGDLGGFVSSLEVDGIPRLSGNAWVCGNAWVFGNARVLDNAWVFGNAWVCNNAQVFGNAQVLDNAWVCDNARVSNNARVFGGAQVCGDARVFGDAWVYGDALVYGNARVCVGEVDSVSAIIVITITFKFSVTVLREHIQIGCETFLRSELHKITEQGAIEMGIPKELHKGYVQMIKGAMLLVKEEPNEAN